MTMSPSTVMSSPDSDTTDRVPTETVTDIEPQSMPGDVDAAHSTPETSSKSQSTKLQYVDLPTDGIRVSGNNTKGGREGKEPLNVYG